MKGNCLNPGTQVIHKWSHPFQRPLRITADVLQSHSMHAPGILLSKHYGLPFSESKVPYWDVKVGDIVSQWREDMIHLMS